MRGENDRVAVLTRHLGLGNRGDGNRGCRLGGRAERLLHHGRDVGAKIRRQGLSVARSVDDIGQGIAGAEQEIDHLGGRLNLALPDGIEQAFEHMRKRDQRPEPERAGSALDRVHRPEYRVQGIVFRAAIGQPIEIRLQRVE